jgi:hypothetical protein
VAGGEDSGFEDGLASSALFCEPVGVCLDSTDQSILVVDADGHRLRKIKNGLERTHGARERRTECGRLG